jgi:hypothetical protein
MPLELYGPSIAACYACATVCDRCAIAALEDFDPQTRCIGLAMDCAQMCRTAAALMSRRSDFADIMCEACAQVCEACAVECSLHDAHCRQCAEACARCARLCHDMARQTFSGATYA